MPVLKPSNLSVRNIIFDSVSVTWKKRNEFTAALALPALVIILLWAVRSLTYKEYDFVLGWTHALLAGAASCIFAVTCHRLILTNEHHSVFRNILGGREIKFILMALLVYTIFYFINSVFMTIIVNLPTMTEKFRAEGDWNYYMKLVAIIPSFYFLARVCLVFPATAVGKKSGLKWSWRNTKDHSIKILIIIGLYPWAISWLLWLLWRENATIVEDVIVCLLYLVALALEIVALSLTYKAITQSGENWVLDA